ncbi:MAG TPA: hypothetical protein ENN34_03940 [Deltaproteobacteria bacterium]|nr:hypothetical protein [Deltaproteobacteria bacterium]
MEPNERLSALELALNNEMNEREFYLKHAERTRNPVGKAMFQEIADDELEHYQRLKDLHQTWEKKEKWPQSVPLTVKNTNIKDVLKGALQNVDKEAVSDDDDLKALATATAFEAKGAEFYAGLRDAVTDEREKAFFDLLARIEREHYLSLKDTEEYLKDPDSWFRKSEHHSLDGA